MNAEPFAASISAIEVCIAPLLVFTNEFDIAVSGCRYFCETLLEGKIAKDSPQHD
jgi:hypothetical protein